ncbi:MAG: hypothetical protein ABT02_20015 [Comamonadaceae bacterium SCN 68-20]|nr:MAG: hypothetical protein ABT02_20015 [Comamonadaceae bacterium SCN 68-20]OJX21775.1 MAG: hypothetical protein BGO75_13725 [Burkholderiales bacterium 68-20]
MKGVFDPDELVKDGESLIEDLVILPNYSVFAAFLWCTLSWCYGLFNRCPLLLINAPEKECGKTQMLKIVGKLAHRSLETANISLPSLFRVVDEYGPTILIDEADTFMSGNLSQPHD